MSDTSTGPDVVEDGGIKCSIPVINKLFSACASGEAAASAPKTPNPDAPKNGAEQLVKNGGIGDGMAANAGKALMNRQQQLDAQMKGMGL